MKRSTVFNRKVAAINKLASIITMGAHCWQWLMVTSWTSSYIRWQIESVPALCIRSHIQILCSKHKAMATGTTPPPPWCYHITYKLLHILITAIISKEEMLTLKINTTSNLPIKYLKSSSYSLVIILKAFYLGLNISKVLLQQKSVNNCLFWTSQTSGPRKAWKACFGEIFASSLKDFFFKKKTALSTAAD